VEVKINTHMIHRHVSYVLDALSGMTFLGGIFAGENIAIFLGGLASFLAIVNHAQQILGRKKK
jgi:hypothetical protein